ncbi:MAG: uracil-DNA glycosylase family protein, partial [Alphaproteobacteria bacterium]|nr:uracil-DNA glycosylase family protein [Alphaproteobacteria bacterium]
MQLTHLHEEFDRLQEKHGSPNLDSIYGAGCTHEPEICFIFMNPTGRNIASAKSWKGLKAPWLGTKNAWKLFNSVKVLSDKTLENILSMRPDQWDYGFARLVYEELAANKVYVTNLGKCTKDDASHVSDRVFHEYLGLLGREILDVKPKKIIAFGNQVSSLLLGVPVKVSQMRRQSATKVIAAESFQVFPVYYPVGQGM